MSPLDEAIEIVGGRVSDLAKAIGEKNPETVNNWRTRGVPVEKCIDIEKATGVLCESLRPDIDWAYLRKSKKQKPKTEAA